MKALVLQQLHHPLVLQETAQPRPARGEALVRLKAAALNRRDWWITQGQYSQIQLPVILGSDGAGEYQGKPVVLYPAGAWGNDPRVQGKDFRILGLPENGTFAEWIVVRKQHVVPKPGHLSWEQAAALPLAGLTAYRVLFSRCRLRPGERVLITGIGGGVALMTLQFALAAGAEVYVTSGSEVKIQKALEIGAKGGANYREADWGNRLKAQSGNFDVVIDSAGGDGFAALMGLCNPAARIGVYGGTLGKINGLSPQILYWKQLSILGSTMGTLSEFKRMLGFVCQHRIVPAVDAVFPLAEGNEAMQRLAGSEQFGKVVLKIDE
ncbi:MAG: zinc-binding dehydrogenase [Saprospirales bacterium]|nr:zinc-binding dehydrogenase [Saprospirales bacterium]MBK8919918.1 zinc-binding dehydrogenase [Saprospirales bacterium]